MVVKNGLNGTIRPGIDFVAKQAGVNDLPKQLNDRINRLRDGPKDFLRDNVLKPLLGDAPAKLGAVNGRPNQKGIIAPVTHFTKKGKEHEIWTTVKKEGGTWKATMWMASGDPKRVVGEDDDKSKKEVEGYRDEGEKAAKQGSEALDKQPRDPATASKKAKEVEIEQVKVANAKGEEAPKTTLLNPAGKFEDAALEASYNKYVTRNTAAKMPVRDRLDWKEQRDYWLNDSPVARGNKFNQTAGKNYDFNEVHLENGKRLDSYDPKKGEIISRKATDFDVIEESTFRDYLSELKSKYAPGTTIRSDKYPFLDGKKLKGEQILEVPDSNLNAANRRAFEKIASEMEIKIRYTAE